MDYYEVLKINKDSSENDWEVIKSRFHHYFTYYCKTRNLSELDLFVEAYCVLSHLSLKQIYDQALYNGSEEIFKKLVAYQFSFFYKQFDGNFEAIDLFFIQNKNDVLEWIQEKVSKIAPSLIEFYRNRDNEDELIVTTRDLRNHLRFLLKESDEIFELLSEHIKKIIEKWGDYVVPNKELEDLKVKDILEVVYLHAFLVYTRFENMLFDDEEVKTGIFEIIDELTRLRFFVGKFFHPDIKTLIETWKKELESINEGELVLFFKEFEEFNFRLFKDSFEITFSDNTKKKEELKKRKKIIISMISTIFSEDLVNLTYQNGWKKSYNLIKKINIESEKTDPLKLAEFLEKNSCGSSSFWVVILLILVFFAIAIFFISLFSQWRWVYSKKNLKKKNFRKWKQS